MTCLRPTRRNALPAIFRRREYRKLRQAAERHAARKKREAMTKALRGVPFMFPIDDLSVN